MEGSKTRAPLIQKQEAQCHISEKIEEHKICLQSCFHMVGKLDKSNRWLKISNKIPWEELEKRYEAYFADIGRPGTDGRLAVGLFLLKHMSGKGDVEDVLELQKNPPLVKVGVIKVGSFSPLYRRRN